MTTIYGLCAFRRRKKIDPDRQPTFRLDPVVTTRTSSRTNPLDVQDLSQPTGWMGVPIEPAASAPPDGIAEEDE